MPQRDKGQGIRDKYRAGWRDGQAHFSQQPYGSSQLSVDPVPGSPHTDRHADKTPMHIKNNNKETKTGKGNKVGGGWDIMRADRPAGDLGSGTPLAQEWLQNRKDSVTGSATRLSTEDVT